MRKIVFISFIVSTLFYCAAKQESGASSEDASTDDVLITAEEKIQNPLFAVGSEVTLNSPGHDTVKNINMITFNRSTCGDYQVTIIADERLLVDNGEIINVDVALVGWHDTEEPYEAGNTLSLSDFFSVTNGDIGETSLTTLNSGTRYYWASWSYSLEGELICSSPQFSFFVR
ncbi:MAG: hypothetical protein OEZ13_06195 [Spirochaetia bacterium]|nr:hypothetical protein [Spirochaetia bacterium]